MSKKVFLFVVGSLLTIALSACGGGGGGGGANATVVNWLGILDEGQSMTWALNSGTYRLEMTSNPNGASVQWTPGSGCQNYSEVTTYAFDCTLPINGQVKITNPTTLGLGPSESVTVHITRK